LAAVFLLTHLATWLLSGFFDPLRHAAADRLFALRSAVPSLAPPYDDTIVHVVVDDESLRESEDFYIGRDDHARLVRNLHRLGVALQFHDVIFARPLSDAEDHELETATAEAGNAYFGMGLALSGGRAAARAKDPGHAVNQAWPVAVDPDGPDLPEVGRYFATYPALAEKAAGLGFLDLVPDGDGIFRRAPLLARDGAWTYPAIALRLAADYLGVPPERIEAGPGNRITLRGARRPGSAGPADVVIPVDAEGRIVADWLGPWGAMKAYPFATIHDASDDRFTMEDLREELEGKIAIVSWLATGAEDIGAVPTDPLYPRAGIHATVLNSILTGNFLREPTRLETVLWVELPLLALLLAGALRLSTIPFVAGALGLAAAYLAVVAGLFLWAGWILDAAGPLIVLAGSAAAVAGRRFHVEAQARARLDREMDVARDIQMRTFPREMPAPEGYELAGRSEPAEETGGDTFDVVALGDRRMLLLGDATGHGVGPALSVTQVRSMLRIAMRLDADLDTTLREINDQLASDLASNRFVTAFLGLLDPRAHTVTYHAAGQGPLLHYRAATGDVEWHGSTTTPMGLMEQLAPAAPARIEMAPGDILGLMTDGLYEYENTAGAQFGEEAVARLVREHRDRPVGELLQALFDAVRAFGRGVPQADDITMLLVRRLPGPAGR
jgi:serine phosphatase RsbU (regulator of sigma subunit)